MNYKMVSVALLGCSCVSQSLLSPFTLLTQKRELKQPPEQLSDTTARKQPFSLGSQFSVMSRNLCNKQDVIKELMLG